MDAGSLPQRLLRASELPARWAGRATWTVLDTRFASLAPFLACWRAWQQDMQRPRMLHYVGVLTPDQAAQLPAIAQSMAEANPACQAHARALAVAIAGLVGGQHRILLDNGQLSLTVCVGEAAAMLAEQQFLADTVWQRDDTLSPDLWHLKALARLSARGATLCLSNGGAALSPLLQQAGFTDIRQYDGWTVACFQPRWTLGVRDQTRPPPTPARCAVVGAGMAGASVACTLARRGWQVTIVDQHAASANGASGLPVGLVVPHISADDSPRSRMSRVGVRLMLQHANSLLHAGTDWAACGVQEHDLERGDTHWHAQGAWIRPAQLVQAWLRQPHIQSKYGARVASIVRGKDTWLLRNSEGDLITEAELVVVANATGCVPLLLAPTLTGNLAPSMVQRLLSLHAVHGTVSFAQHGSADAPQHWPQHAHNGHGYFVPSFALGQGRGWLTGSTFEPDQIPEQPGHQIAPLHAQHLANSERLAALLPGIGQELAPAFASGEVQHWSGTRCAAHDRLPLIGTVLEEQDGMANSLWLHVAMGARGLTFSALGAELLAAQLGAEPLPIERNLARSLDVRRPKRRRGQGASSA